MKTLSVTDLTAGTWCELQHFYTLTRLPGGKKTRTAAMKRGTRLHEKLEREVFRTVQVEVTKREDNSGLKLWNMIQGLRVLRDQGATREFENNLPTLDVLQLRSYLTAALRQFLGNMGAGMRINKVS